MGADGVMISDLVELLAVDGPAYASTLTTAIAASDFAEADRVAHTLKGSISYFEARPAFELARQVEMAARTRQASEARALASRLTLEIAHLIAELQEWVQTLPSAAPPQTVGRDAVLVPRG
jgi:HPt (histidine-containing phosphotransfer) domain-containing protein